MRDKALSGRKKFDGNMYMVVVFYWKYESEIVRITYDED